ncbi:CobW family GTP-binding protein [Magnetococcales bacterium HHB-1]
MPKSTRLPVILLTGFLGSGKTTVLNHLIHQPQWKETLVVINELGQIGLDHDLVAEALKKSGAPSALRLESGCLCCAIREDLVKTLRDAWWRYARGGQPWFSRVLIETTGLADPTSIIHTMFRDETLYKRYALHGTVTCVDAVNGMTTLDNHQEAVKQAAMADLLLLTKTDLAKTTEQKILQTRLRHLNPSAELLTTKKGVVDPAQLLTLPPFIPEERTDQIQNWLREVDHRHHSSHDHHAHDDGIQTFSIHLEKPVRESALTLWLDFLKLKRGPDLLRVKGIINIEGHDTPMALHGAQHLFHPLMPLPAWPDEDRRSRIVFITRGVEAQELRDANQLLE